MIESPVRPETVAFRAASAPSLVPRPVIAPKPVHTPKRPLTVLTWHIHGSYLNYLAHSGHEFVVPVLPGRPPRYAGRPLDATWPENVREVPAEKLVEMHFDAILYQHHDNWTEDRALWLSEKQLDRIPQAFLEHDPPREHPTDTAHVVHDPRVPVVHVTHFNELMWNCRQSPTRVIEHGVTVPDDAQWNGGEPAGIAVVNNIVSRGRRLGPDVLDQMRQRVPVDLIGMGSHLADGAGEVPHHAVPYTVGGYRFFFNPIRYTSLGLAVLEAMMVGTPVLGLATTEMAVAVTNGVNGYVHTDVGAVADFAECLIEDRGFAAQLSQGAREYAREHHGIERFAREWDAFLTQLAN